VEEANKLYYQEHRKEFPFAHCWIPSSFVSLESDDTSCITPSGTPSGGSVVSPRKRPARKRKEKEAIRKSKIQEAKDTKFYNLLEQFTKSVTEKDASKAAKDALKAEKFAKKTELEERKVKAMEEMASIERREIERKEKETEMQIMNMNLSEIDDPRQKAYYNQLKNDIISKMLARQDVQDYYPSLDGS
ncbi:hypothetical protein Dimus_001791, partial [Dionaea muscipula]